MKRLDVRTAPLHVDDFDIIGAVLRWTIGIGFVGYSIATTSLIISGVLAPVMESGVNLLFITVPWRVLIGAMFGLIITAAEWATSKRAPLVHWALILILDAPFSAYQTYVWIMMLAEAHQGAGNVVTWLHVVIILLSIAWGVLVAKFGEKLLITAKERQAAT